MAYINPAPGTANQVTLSIEVAVDENDITQSSPLSVPALQDMTINAANDVFTWSQLDSTAKKQVATTSTNSIAMNIVLDKTTFFGTTLNSTVSDTIAAQGIFGASRNKTLINFVIRIENAAADTFIKGCGYITGLAPTVTADAPVWVSPITITVVGEYTVAAT